MIELDTIYRIRGRVERNGCEILILLVDYLAKARMGRAELINWKGCEGEQSWPYLRQCPRNCLEGLEKTTKTHLHEQSDSLSRFEMCNFRTTA
jgi:hypothetical protein